MAIWAHVLLAWIAGCVWTGVASAQVAIVPGATEAQFNVAPDGGATYSVPLRTVPGTAGIQPKLGLAYNSRAGRSPFGIGWNVSGLSIIQRSPKNIRDDGQVSGVLFDDLDALSLDGEKLVPVKTQGSGTSKSVEYRSRIDTYARITAYEWTVTGPTRFLVETRSGLRMHYGSAPNSRVALQSGTRAILFWLCDQVEDRSGNFMSFRYVEGEPLQAHLKQVTFTGKRNPSSGALVSEPYASLEFEYDRLAQPYELRYVNGEEIRARLRLRRIVSKFQKKEFRVYEPQYTLDPGVPGTFRLASLEEIGQEGAQGGRIKFRPTVFSYSQSTPGWGGQLDLPALPELPEVTLASAFKALQVKVGGKLAWAMLYRINAHGKEVAGALYYDPDPSSQSWKPLTAPDGTPTFIPPVPLADERGPASNIAWIDVDADGRDDLLVSDADPAKSGVYLNAENGWRKLTSPLPFPVIRRTARESGILVADLPIQNVRTRVLLWNQGSGAGLAGAVRLSNDQWIPHPELVPPRKLNSGSDVALDRVYAIDAQCDGIPELMYFARGAAFPGSVHSIGANGWMPAKPDLLPQVGQLPDQRALTTFVKGDGCTQVLAAYQVDGNTTRSLQTARGGVWTADGDVPSVVLWRSRQGQRESVARVFDVNGDGLPDIVAHRGMATRYAYLGTSNGGWQQAPSWIPPERVSGGAGADESDVQPIRLDGRPLLVHTTTTALVPKVFAHRVAGGWEQAKAYRLPDSVSIAAFNKADLGIRFVDLNGDGFPDLVLAIARPGGIESKAWLFNPKPAGAGWVEANNYALPEALVNENYADTGVILADVNGDGVPDLMSARERPRPNMPGEPVQMELLATTYLNCTRAGTPGCDAAGGIWQKNAALASPVPFVREGFGPLGVQILDLDGNGLPDILASRMVGREPGDDPDSTDGVSVPQPPPPPGTPPQEPEKRPPSPYYSRSVAYLNVNGSWQKAPQFELRHPSLGVIPIARQIHCPTPSDVIVYPPVPPAPGCANYQDLPGAGGQSTTTTRVEFIDLNGDRRPDAVFHFRTYAQVYDVAHKKWEIVERFVKGALINTGHGWADAPGFAPVDRLEPDPPPSWSPTAGVQVMFDDVNGDGLLDLAYLEKGKSRVLLNTGLSWGSPNAVYRIPDEALSTRRGDSGMRLMDLNGDGLVDIVYHRAGGNDAGKGAFLNNGFGWEPVKATDAFVPNIALAEDGLGDIGVRPFDVNGDGLADIVQVFARRDSTTTRKVDINLSGKPDLLVSIANGMGGVTTIEHNSFLAYAATKDTNRTAGIETTNNCQPSTANNADANAKKIDRMADVPLCASVYPYLRSNLPGYVVVRTWTFGIGVEQRAATYRYAEYRTDVLSGRSLGFRWQEVADEERKRITRTVFEQADGAVGIVQASSTYQSIGTGLSLIAETNATTRVVCTDGFTEVTCADHGPQVKQSRMERQVSSSWDLIGVRLGTTSSDFKYDIAGNVLEVHTSTGDGQKDSTRNRYADDAARWLRGRLVATESVRTLHGKTNPIKRASFSYAPTTGLLTMEAQLVGTDYETRTTYCRDSWGNKWAAITRARKYVDASGTHQQVSGYKSLVPPYYVDELCDLDRAQLKAYAVANEQSVRIGMTEFDEMGRFAVKSINPAGHTSAFQRDPASGSINKQWDPNGIASSFVFDGFQRVVEEVSPSGMVTKTRMAFAAGRPSVVYSVSKTAGSSPPVVVYYDTLGRARHAVSGSGRYEVHASTTFDRLGRATRTELPRFATATSRPEIVRVFDELDRPVLERRPDGTRTELRYRGLTRTKVDMAGRTTVVKSDEAGRVLEVIDAMGGSTLFEFDSSGRNTEVVNALGHRVKNGYDDAGNRSSLSDPSAGDWRYVYNAFGDMVLQIDPRGVRTLLEYDPLGRIRSRAQGTRSTFWTYDTCPRGIGRICAASVSGGDATEYGYDSAGRLATSRIQVASDQLTLTLGYDQMGRIESRTYDTGVSIVNSYSDQGTLERVSLRDGDKHIKVYEVVDRDELGRAAKELLGENIARDNIAHPMTRRIEQIATKHRVTGESLQDFRLTYLPSGNIESRRELTTGQADRFDYDRLDRITSWSSVAGKTDVHYDALGNIQTRGSRLYKYCDKNGLVGLLCGVDGIDGSLPLEYDKAGNVIQLGETRFHVDDAGRVVSARDGQHGLRYSEFSYGVDGQLVQHESRDIAMKFRSHYLGDVEVMREEFTTPLLPTPERTRVRYHVSGDKGAVGFYEQTHFHYPYKFASPFTSIGSPLPARTTRTASSFTFFLKDQIGSVVALVNEAAKVFERFEYDVWGKRKSVQAKRRFENVLTGFTGHVQLSHLDLIHMGGRIYSPELGRFLSPDILVQARYYSQSYNRFSYVVNNPLRLLDPDGNSWLSDAWDSLTGGISDVWDGIVKAVRWTGEQINKAGAWIGQNWRLILIVAVAIVAPYALAFVGITGITAAVVTGAVVGGLSAGLYGGGPNEIIRGALLGAILGAATFGAAQISNTYVQAGAQGAVGGVGSAAQGGRFEQGFASGLVSYAGQGLIDQVDSSAYNVAASAVVGGCASEVGGGTFENGATTAAFVRTLKEIPGQYKKWVGYDLDSSPGGERVDKESTTPPAKGKNNVGFAGHMRGRTDLIEVDGKDRSFGDCGLCEGGKISKWLNERYGINGVAGLHDVFQNKLGEWGGPDLRNFSVTNYGGMVVAAGVVYPGYLGQLANSSPAWVTAPVRNRRRDGESADAWTPIASY